MTGLRTLATLVLLSAAIAHADCLRSPKKVEKPRHEPMTVPMRLLLSHAIASVQPVFPEEARRAHIDGEVVIAIEVNHEGNVTQTQLLSGEPSLRAAAEFAAKQWRFDPFCIDGRPYTVRSVLDFQFRWRGSGAATATP
ncbi:energy transducer TonB [Terriglobus roseus]|uniref:Protein TonB n=1 Tax=Terriglobus roseus TaxID=392734 RepID=A0A1H4L989_9BACT|nr:energy transducer TonB [Terriglobus roseus]SEB67309.1 protein TonB [Terriglobus roseus]